MEQEKEPNNSDFKRLAAEIQVIIHVRRALSFKHFVPCAAEYQSVVSTALETDLDVWPFLLGAEEEADIQNEAGQNFQQTLPILRCVNRTHKACSSFRISSLCCMDHPVQGILQCIMQRMQ